MLKRILMIMVVTCLMPVMAHAASWTLTSAAKTVGGAIQVGTGTPRTSLQGNLITTYTYTTTPTPVNVTVAPNAGYAVSKVVINGVTTNNPTQTVWSVVGTTAQTFYVYFAVQKYNITASVAGNVGGTVNPASITNITGGSQLGTTSVVTFTPVSSLYALSSVSGIPAGATQSPLVPLSGQSVTVTFPSTFVVNTNINLVGTFVSNIPTANAGGPQTVFAGNAVTLSGDNSLSGGGISIYAWSQTSGPATAVLANANASRASFIPTVSGTYTFSLTLMPGGSSASTTVTVYADANQFAIDKCQNCHSGTGNPVTTNAYQKWATSKHQSNYVVCANCHVGADTGGHPGVVPENKCISCHNSTLGISPAITVGHMGIVDTYKTTCYGCHKHDLTVSGSLSCAGCHGYPPDTQTIHTTGFKKYTHVSATCADCHSVPTTTAAVGDHRDGAVEVLTTTNACSSCHSYPPVSAAHATAVAGSAPNCSTCHVYNFYTDATHNNGTLNFTNLACNACHGHPPTVLSLAISGKTGPHPLSTDCAMCHGYNPIDPAAAGLHRNGTLDVLKSGAPHFNNSTSANYSASYVTSQVTSCAFCHNANVNNLAIRQQWATSGHANTEAALAKVTDFKVFSPCVRCHTTTGFIAYSTARMVTQWGLATDKTKEVITCVACHSDVANGVVRTVTPNKPYESDQSFTNTNVGSSNVCMDCHGGRDSGNFIQSKVGTVDFTNTPYQYNTHYMVAGGILQGSVGFNFPGRTYTAFTENSHSKIGMGSMGTGTSGPCAGCHMSATAKHKFSVATEVSGTITALETNVCVNCHNTSLPATTLNNKRVTFQAALEILRIQLAAKGYTWDATVKTFYAGATNIVATNWGVGQAGANVMGAAYNYKMFITEPSAYAHNPAYAKELITDSIDAVYNNGTVTGSIDSALADLQANNKITAGQVTAINSYKQADGSCNSCHGNPPDTSFHVGVVAGTCSSCHIFTGAGGVTHNNGVVDMQSGTGACSSCHGYPPTSQVIHTTGVVKYNHDKVGVDYTNCAQCHSVPATSASTATHRNGTVDLETNANACNSCHSAPPATSIHSAATLAPFNCTNCHIYTVSSASTHNNGAVDFSGSITCDSCHGYPPLPLAQLTARANGAFANAKVEDYANGGGHHATHLLSSVSANEGFTPCLPCHPNTHHAQGGGTVVRTNVNVFEASDLTFRFDDARPKQYNTASLSCSNVSCHFQPTAQW